MATAGADGLHDLQARSQQHPPGRQLVEFDADDDDGQRGIAEEPYVRAPSWIWSAVSWSSTMASTRRSCPTGFSWLPPAGPLPSELFGPARRDSRAGRHVAHTVPEAITKSTVKQYRHSNAVTELIEFADRGHSLTIDSRSRSSAFRRRQCPTDGRQLLFAREPRSLACAPARTLGVGPTSDLVDRGTRLCGADGAGRPPSALAAQVIQTSIGPPVGAIPR